MRRIKGSLRRLWGRSVRGIRHEIMAQDTPALVYAKELCDKLECSMCTLSEVKE